MITYNKNNYYLHYLKMISSHDHPDVVFKLCPQERAFFEAIVLHWHQGSPLTVTQAVNLAEHGSTVTLHKRLKSLADQEVIVFRQKDDSMRRKFVCPSPQAVMHLERLSKLIAELPTQVEGKALSDQLSQAVSTTSWMWEI